MRLFFISPLLDVLKLKGIPEGISNIIVFLVVIVLVIFVGKILQYILRKIAVQLGKSMDKEHLFESCIKYLNCPLTFLLPFALLYGFVDYLPMSPHVNLIFLKILTFAIIISIAWIIIGLIYIARDEVYFYFHKNDTDNLKERKVTTQIQFISRILVACVVVITICVLLLSFERFRELGTTMLTGVGISGIIIGFAAQKSLGNLLAGFQIAFTQPIRLDDVLVVEGEWGRVEEITLTYVVVNIWDKRRLVLPINYFIEKPFQNWTRTTADLLGTSFLYVDYSVPLEKIRAEFTRLLEQNPIWDKKVNVVHVTDLKEKCMEIRLLMSAKESGPLFQLRCDIREGMIQYIVANYPNALSKTRIEMSKEKIVL
ncbi:mechanosensitive ion channel family protein [Rhizosphaericola mali]|uniref:Mechanosensitive ion channel n=1 Tax=Rhizosphaericola mali TaxID=2545455 RepID=A0A5P2G731_9BACT|nr:mechanosensitive ion channel domain-containing protein [Rhizosphaericola mali]QES87321.1 mechanosensitive ion channel [Rhizosphaericola mali]